MIVPPPAIEAYVRRVLVDRDLLQISLGPRGFDHATIDLDSLLWRLRMVREADKDWLYVRNDSAKEQSVRWAYYDYLQ